MKEFCHPESTRDLNGYKPSLLASPQPLCKRMCRLLHPVGLRMAWLGPAEFDCLPSE